MTRPDADLTTAAERETLLANWNPDERPPPTTRDKFREWLKYHGAADWPTNDAIAAKAEKLYGQQRDEAVRAALMHAPETPAPARPPSDVLPAIEGRQVAISGGTDGYMIYDVHDVDAELGFDGKWRMAFAGSRWPTRESAIAAVRQFAEREAIDAELAAAGIDMNKPIERLRAMVQVARAGQAQAAPEQAGERLPTGPGVWERDGSRWLGFTGSGSRFVWWQEFTADWQTVGVGLGGDKLPTGNWRRADAGARTVAAIATMEGSGC